MGFMRIKNTGFSAAMVTQAQPWAAMFVRGGDAAQVSAAGLASNGPISELGWTGYVEEVLQS